MATTTSDALLGVSADTDAASRTYVVGLPVVLTVRPDGSLHVEVDLSEAADLRDASYPEDQDDATLNDDEPVIQAAINTGRVTFEPWQPLPTDG